MVYALCSLRVAPCCCCSCCCSPKNVCLPSPVWLDLQCMHENFEKPSTCQALVEDYMECLHHRKYVSCVLPPSWYDTDITAQFVTLSD